MLLTTGCVAGVAFGLNILRTNALPSPAVHHTPPATARTSTTVTMAAIQALRRLRCLRNRYCSISFSLMVSPFAWIGSCIIARSP